MTASIQLVLMEFSKLAVGLVIAMFHRQIAEFILLYERAFVVHCRQRGLMVPDVVTTQMACNVYFILGIFTATYQMFRIWTLIH
jgi:hypothetical protein